MAGPGHNSSEDGAANERIGGIAAEALQQYVDRIERLSEERKALSEDISQVYKEAVATGFDRKALKALIAERAKDPHTLAETNEILDLYRRTVNGTHIATRAGARDDE